MLARITRYAARKVFRPAEKYLKLHITPAHFYSPIPTVGELDPRVYDKVFDCDGIDWNLPEQLKQLELVAKYRDEFTPESNRGLSLVDAFILYALVRAHAPRVMIEIGSGASTKVTLQALQRNRSEGRACEFYAIEPYPDDELRSLQGVRLIDRQLQQVDISLLRTADILFIDSSHVCKIGSDVNYEILEIVPKLKVGALVHWHDIVMPKNYWREWIENGNQFWNESYVVHSFMLFNESFKIVWASMYLHLTQDLRIFPYLKPDHHLMSFWVRRAK